MRKTSFDLDQESTIISMLAVRGLPVDGTSSRSSARLSLKVLLACVALLLVVIAFVQENPSWQ
jgi:hypothetical protein